MLRITKSTEKNYVGLEDKIKSLEHANATLKNDIESLTAAYANSDYEKKILCLEQTNTTLLKDTESLTSAYKKLLNLYVSDLFNNNGEKIPDICWDFTKYDIINGGPLKGTCNKDKIYCTPTESGYDITVEKIVVTKLNSKKEIAPPINPTLLTIPDVDMSEADFDVIIDDQNTLFDKAKLIVDEHLKKAKESGATEMYINKGGEILYPFNVSGNVKARISDDRLLNEDEFDELVDAICDSFKSVEVIEDLDLMVFHFGGDCVD